MRIALVVGLVLLAGCVSQGRFPSLAEDEKQRFFRCQKAIEPARCGTITSDVYEVQCVRSAQNDYSAQPTTQTRQEWLMANGCPPFMAQR